MARAPHFKLKDALVAVRRSLDADERRLASEIRKESRARRWLSASRPLLTNAEQALEQTGFLRDESHVVAHLDLWGSHIVVDESENATFLDCSTIGSAPAVVDMAQLIARNGAWSDERVERVLQRYADEMPLAPVQRRMLPWLTALDAISTCGHLLVRAHDDRDPLSDNGSTQRARRGRHPTRPAEASLESAFVPRPPKTALATWQASRQAEDYSTRLTIDATTDPRITRPRTTSANPKKTTNRLVVASRSLCFCCLR